MTDEMKMTEEEVFERISAVIGKTSGLVVGNFPARDTDRFMTFYNASKENGRKPLIDLKQAYLLEKLEDDPICTPKLNDKNIMIYYRKKLTYDKWENEIIERAKNLVEASEIKQKEAVLYCSSFGVGELIDIKPSKGSSYIYSMCSPFNEEMELEHERLMNWVKHFKLEYFEAHASGHASPDELKWVIDSIKPKMVIPVHTENALRFREFHSNVKVLKNGERVEVD